ncbi:MAG: nickel pincer cofactor biosynthesis protein LarB [Alphaproteobacteria bacterium]|nr:nickel pincer cofactor biosynthesis protein LarB [Alphaproteobacteria bacterium]
MKADEQASTVRFDLGRRHRIGLAEAILADVKTSAQIAEAIRQSGDGGAPVLVTRLSQAQFSALPEEQRAGLNYDPVSRTALSASIAAVPEVADIAVVTGGTGDVAVAREVARTLVFHGVASHEIIDVGVAGLWRLMEHREMITKMPVIIVCAGMEGALFSVVGGLAGGVVIAVPTSNGYGVAEGGGVALNSALASCAPGIAVCNIDNGYGAACLALRVLGMQKRQGWVALSPSTGSWE